MNAFYAADIPAPEKVIITFDYAYDEFLAKDGGYDKYVDGDSEYGINVVFRANVAVDGFQYVSLDYVESTSDNDNVNFEVENVLYAPPQLTPERPFVVTMLLDGTIPNRGITYIDENGTTRYFTISMSGQDNSLCLRSLSQ